jgi:CubicO group peptidase (beta-lactamase class C family)
MHVRMLAALSAASLVAVSAHAGITASDDADMGITPSYAVVCLARQTPANAINAAVDPAHPPAGVKGLMVAYVDPSNAPTYEGYGVATTGGTTPDEHTLFGIGSLTKLFTATLLGRLAVQDSSILTTPVPVPSAFPNLRPNTTFTDLADHHGGLPKNAARNLDTVNDLWAEYTSTPIQCDPTNPDGEHDCGCCTSTYQSLIGGTVSSACNTNLGSVTCAIHGHTTGASGFVYSNEGFAVLGHALATRLGYSTWWHANKDYVTTPLGMPDTVTRENLTSAQEARAANHCTASGSNTDCQLLNWLPVGNAAGGLFSTAADLVKFLQYNMSQPPTLCDSIVSPCDLYNALPIIHKTYDYSNGGPVQLAWQVKTVTSCGVNVDLVWKDGANGPFRSWMGYLPSQHRGVVLLANADGFDLPTIGQTILLTAQ